MTSFVDPLEGPFDRGRLAETEYEDELEAEGLGEDDSGLLAALDGVPPGVLDTRWEAVIEWFRGLALLGLGDDDTEYVMEEVSDPEEDEEDFGGR